MTRRKNDFCGKSWVTIAAVIGVIAVVVIAALFFMGSGDSTGPSGQATVVPSGTGTPNSQVSRYSDGEANDAGHYSGRRCICQNQLYWRFFGYVWRGWCDAKSEKFRGQGI